MASHDDFDVSDDDDSVDIVSEESTTVAPPINFVADPVNDLAFVAALAEAEIEQFNTVDEKEDNNFECGMDEVTHMEQQSDEEKELESDSESSSSSDDDEDDDDDDDDEEKEGSGKNKMINSDDEDGPVASSILRTKHEIVAEVIEPVCLELNEGEELSLVGEVMSVVMSENTIVIQSIRTQTPLDEGSVLCLGDRKIIGKVSELFGPLSSPFYIVKHSSAAAQKKATYTALATATATPEEETGAESTAEEEMKVNVQQADIEDIQPGVSVFVAVQHSSYVTPHSLSIIRNIKGSDASNMWDEEVSSVVQTSEFVSGVKTLSL
jgi:rRNA processing protein Gar1